MNDIELPQGPETQEEAPSQETPRDIPDDVKTAIITCTQFYAQEDWGTRNVMMAFWKKLELYFDGIQRIYWAFDAADWRNIDSIDNSASLDPTLYDKIINIYRAHGESLISALSIKLPRVVFYPDDADNIDDINTAKASSRISELIEKHNQGILLFMKAIFYLYNQGVACAYIYNRANSSYGTVRIPEYGEDVKLVNIVQSCPNCGDMLGQEELKNPDMMPDLEQASFCPTCNIEVVTNNQITEEFVPQIIGYKNEPKSKTAIDIFGPMYVQMPFYARNQEGLPYIRLKFEQHRAILQDLYPEFRDRILTYPNNDEAYGRWARSYAGRTGYEYSRNLVTTTCQWLRPWAFEILDQPELIEKCKKQFPKGCYAVIVGDTLLIEARDESLDEHWEITHHPLANYIHADPMGKVLAPIQELRNEATDLAIETFEHSIPETFVDSEVLNFDKYAEEEAKPGMVYPVKAKMGRTIADAFHSTKTATLSEEIDGFIARLDTDGQFTSGDLPSLHGGVMGGGSKTASEYAQSRAQALQRLNVTWSMLKHWWARVMGKAVQQYINAMVADEKLVERSATTESGFVNVIIKQAELTGKIGNVEPDSEEEMPTSYSQVKQTLMELITLNNETVNEGLFHPQNVALISKAFGIPELHIPGQDDRDKQYGEIQELLKGMPLNIDEVDTDAVHIETIKSWGVSQVGIYQKKTNPQGYALVMEHMNLHIMRLQAQLAAQQANQEESEEKTDSQQKDL